MDVSTVCAAALRGLLHDPLEVEGALGREVGTILRVHADVAALVTTTQHDVGGERKAADFYGGLRECILLAANVDRRAVSVELAAAVVATRALGRLGSEDERALVARRAMNLYAPLANRMGIYFIQSELEELAFMHLQPEPFRAISRELAALTRESQDVLAENKAALDRALSTAPGVRLAVRSVAVKGRIKGVYSCYRKVQRTGRPLSELYDLLALRVIVQARSPDEGAQAAAVFAVADAVRHNFCVVPARAKDYVNNPKPNGYRSLHLTVAHPGARPGAWTPLEIQIRTELMHRVAEFGSAAHWLYKDGSRPVEDREDRGDHAV
jgi:GTP diphosphokinase / guanosine-3',5'-bis(diphosphate) 3'-diphosphatase